MQETERSKITRIFRYLKELDSLRSQLAVTTAPIAHEGSEQPCPQPPAELVDWLKPGWQNAEAKVEFSMEREFNLPGGMSCSVFFQDDEERVRFSRDWVNERDTWAQKQRTTVSSEAPRGDIETKPSAYQNAIKRILTELNDGAPISPALLAVTGLGQVAEPSPGADVASAADAKLLLSKHFNESQLRVARRITQNDAVLVQGPPGTGKSHTIANLLGHLLSEGKSVLVTAHTSKALRVLGSMIVPAVRPLCISVLDDEAENFALLDSALQAINAKLAESDLGELLHEAEELEARRGRIFNALSESKTELFNARFEEMQNVAANGKTFSVAEAALLVRDGAEKYSWLPGPVTAAVTPPISQQEAAYLYQTAHLLSADDEFALRSPLPDAAELPSVSEVALLIAEQSRLAASAAQDHDEYWLPVDPGVDVERLDALMPRIRAVANSIRDASGWWLEVVRAGRQGGVTKAVWEELADQVRNVSKQAEAANPLLQAHRPAIEPPSDEDAGANDATTLDEIRSHLAGSGTLGMWTKTMRRPWHKFMERARVNGEPPSKPEHFEALQALLKLKEAREALRNRWQRQITSAGGPEASSLGAQPEQTASPIVSDIRSRLEWYDSQWQPLLFDLQAIGFQWDAFASGALMERTEYGDMARIRAAIGNGLEQIVRARRDALRLNQAEQSFSNITSALRRHSGSPLAQRALHALAQHDPIGYAEAGRDMSRLAGLQETAARRRDILASLDSTAPAWTAQLRAAGGASLRVEAPADIEGAWQWRQLHDELERRAQTSMNELQAGIERLESELKIATAQLIERRAWAEQKKRVSPELQAALEGYHGCMKKAAESPEARSAALQAAAREHLNAARAAVPVWIMPLGKVHESFFSPAGSQHFDVVIVDEASQCDVTTLAALQLGNKCIIVGDEAQVTPPPFADLDAVQQLITGSLEGIPNAELYDPENSVYHLARSFFRERIFLREHFRSVPEIVQFSNELSYEARMCPLRDTTSSSLKPALLAHRVSNSSQDGPTNEHEAMEVAALLMSCLEQTEYALNDHGEPTSFGVVSMLGNEQAALVEEMLRQHLPQEVFAKHRILCGTPAQFQGDERDVIFLTMVDSGKGAPLPLLGFGPREINRKRFNVATSRARNQMWVVHSLSPETDLHHDDLRRRIIEHALRTRALAATQTASQQDTTPCTLAVQNFLTQRGFTVSANWPAGSARIGLVVHSGTHKLAVECDGDRMVTALELLHDMERQAALERTGWRFVRVRGSVFTRDADRAMQPVLQAIELQGIKPSAPGTVRADSAGPAFALIDRVLGRSRDIRKSFGEAPTAAAPAIPVVRAGDWVEFIVTDSPQHPQFVNLVETPTDLDKCEVNIHESLASALLGRCVNEISRLVVEDFECEIQVKGIHPKGHPDSRVNTF